jgi:YgiT-type zinc finger domain-containing protein
MKCVICRNGETRDGVATLLLERGGATVVVRGVPAQVCDTCGEEYVNESAAQQVTEQAERAIAGGAVVEIRDFVAA